MPNSISLGFKKEFATECLWEELVDANNFVLSGALALHFCFLEKLVATPQPSDIMAPVWHFQSSYA